MTTVSNDPPNPLRELLEEERRALEDTMERAARATNPKVRNVLNSIVELRTRYFKELQARLEEIEAYDEITLEMNQMFW
ncbi:MAG TPA: hypothetical protein VGA55_05045 [Bacteroidota bacterium]